MSIHDAANWSIVIFSALAAILWFLSTTAHVSADSVAEQSRKENGWSPMQIVSDEGADVFETAKRQTKRNRWAAAASCLAALSQAISTLTL